MQVVSTGEAIVGTSRTPSGGPRGSLFASLLQRVNRRDQVDHAGGLAGATDANRGATAAACVIGQQADRLPTDGHPDHQTNLESRLYLEARRQIKRRAWGPAQRALEEVIGREAPDVAPADLQSVRAIRRALRRTARWPSDVDAHLQLGRAYFDLDLGEEALAEFSLVQRLAPHRYEGFALAMLEHLYRGDYALAMSAWLRAHALNPDLPPLDEVMGSLPH
jgi:tetratricopeptide (TPR) repeat protein